MENNTINLNDIISGNNDEMKKLDSVNQMQEMEKTKREVLIRGCKTKIKELKKEL